MDVERLDSSEHSSCCVPRSGIDTIPTYTHHNQGINPFCVPYSLASVLSFKGLHIQEKLMLECAESSSCHQSGGKVIQSAVKILRRSDKWSQIRRMKNFDPLDDGDQSTIKIIQLCAAPYDSVYFDNPKYHDNTHTVTIVDGLLFDSNRNGPLRLTKENLNECCCLGGNSWVLHHISITYEFVPTPKLNIYEENE